MSAGVAKKNFDAAKESYGDVVAKLRGAEVEYQSLTQRLDTMEAETASLNAKVATCEDEEKNVYDSYFLGRASDKDLTDIRKKLQTAKDALSTHSKMIESLARCITGKEREVAALRKQINNFIYQVWQSLFEQKATAIPETIRAVVKELVVIGLNCSMGRDFILPKIFPLPTNTEIQTIYKRLSTDLGID